MDDAMKEFAEFLRTATDATIKELWFGILKNQILQEPKVVSKLGCEFIEVVYNEFTRRELSNAFCD